MTYEVDYDSPDYEAGFRDGHDLRKTVSAKLQKSLTTAQAEIGILRDKLDTFGRGLTERDEQIEALRAENAALKDKALGFIAVWATHYAQGQGYPDGHLHPTHFDLLAEFGGNTAQFTRATLGEQP